MEYVETDARLNTLAHETGIFLGPPEQGQQEQRIEQCDLAFLMPRGQIRHAEIANTGRKYRRSVVLRQTSNQMARYQETIHHQD